MASFGGTVKLTGESEYRRALTQITQNLRETSSALSLVDSQYSKNDNSIATVTAKNEKLNAILEKQKSAYNNLKNSFDSIKTKYDEQINAHNKLQAEYDEEKSKLEKLKNTVGENSTAYEKQKAKVAELASGLSKSQQNIDANEVAMSKLRVQMNNAETSINKTSKEIDNLGKEVKESGKEAEDSKGSWSSWGQTIADLRTKAIEKAIQGMKELGKMAISVGKQAIESYADYEQLAGGAKKIFDELDFKKISKDANDAFKSLGLSVNQYLEVMNTVGANFASTLGDEKGYAIAKEGLQAITDFATGTGKSFDELSTKYQMITRSTSSYLSIADQFAGILPQTTQGFLEQAQASGFLSDEYKKLTNVPVAEYQEALTKMLTKGVNGLGLLGNTAMEAETTLSGSLAMMKSAWSNLLTGIADGNQEIGPLVDNFVDSIASVWENLKPRIRQVIDGVKKIIAELWKKLPEIKDEIPELAPLIDALTWIKKNGPTIISVLSGITAGFVAFKVAGMITTVVTGFKTFFATLKAGQGIMAALNAVMAANPLGLIAFAVAGLVTAFITLWNTSKDFRNFWIGLWEDIKNVFSTVWESIVNFFTVTIPEAFNNVLTTIGTWKDNVISFFSELPSKIGEIVLKVIAFLNQLPYNLGLIVGEMLGHLIKFGIDAFNWVITKVPEIIDGIINFFAELPGKIWEWLVNAYNKVSEWGTNLKNKAIETGTNFINNVINYFSQLPNRIWNFLTRAYNNVSNFAVNIANKGREGARNLFNNVINGIKELPSRMVSIGGDIVKGLWNGIKNAGGWIKDKVSEFAKGILDGMKSALGINSPSRLFRDEVGKNIALGLGEGFTNEMKNVTNEMQSAIPTDFDVNGSYNRINGASSINYQDNYNSLVEAFTEALEGMKIELDDEEVGSFVKKTVENAIYN